MTLNYYLHFFPGIRFQDVDPRVKSMYQGVGVVLSRYRSGKLPKAFKLVPSLQNWEQILYLTSKFLVNLMRDQLTTSLLGRSWEMERCLYVRRYTNLHFEFDWENGSAFLQFGSASSCPWWYRRVQETQLPPVSSFTQSPFQAWRFFQGIPLTPLWGNILEFTF